MPSSSSLKRIGFAIRKEREKAEVSQEKLAELAGLHRTYIGGVERGERNISILNLISIARALKVRLAVLLGAVD